jgi:hypothetical protein
MTPVIRRQEFCRERIRDDPEDSAEDFAGSWMPGDEEGAG